MRQGAILAAAQNVTGHHPEMDSPRPLLVLLDDFLLDNTRLQSGESVLPAGTPLAAWSRYLQYCPTLDFRHWQDRERYSAALGSLLDALRSAPAA